MCVRRPKVVKRPHERTAVLFVFPVRQRIGIGAQLLNVLQQCMRLGTEAERP